MLRNESPTGGELSATYLNQPFESYAAYLDSAVDLFPAALFEFIRDPAHHDFGPVSLHDAHLLRLQIDRQTGTGAFDGKIAFTGHRQDKVFEFTFQELECISTCQVAFGGDQDLLGWEIIASASDLTAGTLFVFRALFPGELLNTEVRCRRISVSVKHAQGL